MGQGLFIQNQKAIIEGMRKLIYLYFLFVSIHANALSTGPARTSNVAGQIPIKVFFKDNNQVMSFGFSEQTYSEKPTITLSDSSTFTPDRQDAFAFFFGYRINDDYSVFASHTDGNASATLQYNMIMTEKNLLAAGLMLGGDSFELRHYGVSLLYAHRLFGFNIWRTKLSFVPLANIQYVKGESFIHREDRTYTSYNRVQIDETELNSFLGLEIRLDLPRTSLVPYVRAMYGYSSLQKSRVSSSQVPANHTRRDGGVRLITAGVKF